MKCVSCGYEYDGNTCDICPDLNKNCDGNDIRGVKMCVDCCQMLGDD